MLRTLCIFLFLLLVPSVSLAKGKMSKSVAPPTVEQMSAAIRVEAPVSWVKGKPFVCLEGQVNLTLHPEEGADQDSICFLPGAIWHFDAMVSEEDWMGRQLLQLRFASPDGHFYRFDTGRTLEAMTDTAYHPVMDGLFPLEMIQKADSMFRARTLYLNINDERVVYCSTCLSDSSFVPMKYVPVHIDSIGFGNVVGPLKVWFSSEGSSGWFFTSLSDSREASTSTPIHRFLSVNDIRLEYPNIADNTWQRLQRSDFAIDMTMEEVRLSIGRPLRFERVTTRLGLIERWFYPNSRVLEFLDGRLSRVGRSLVD